MADRPKDENERKERNLRAVPNQSDAPEDFGSEAEEVVLLPRREQRLKAQNPKDYPWTRRFVGFAIIAAAFIFGWKSLNRRTEELVRQHARESWTVSVPPASVDQTAIAGKPSDLKDSNSTGTKTHRSLELAKLDPKTMTTISECTKGVNAFRQLDVGPVAAAGGQATLESVFAPVLKEVKGQARRVVALQNVRIRTKNGEEWRLHASPQTQGGQLFLKLFRVAQDGLPESVEFPEEIKDLAGARLTDEAVHRFLSQSEHPGQAIEIERHEAWSYPEKVGAQLILSDDQIFDIQVFMRDRFLACNRGIKAGMPTVTCQCVERGHGA